MGRDTDCNLLTRSARQLVGPAHGSTRVNPQPIYNWKNMLHLFVPQTCTNSHLSLQLASHNHHDTQPDVASHHTTTRLHASTTQLEHNNTSRWHTISNTYHIQRSKVEPYPTMMRARVRTISNNDKGEIREWEWVSDQTMTRVRYARAPLILPRWTFDLVVRHLWSRCEAPSISLRESFKRCH